MPASLAIKAEKLSKCYHLYRQPVDRLKQMLFLGRRSFAKEFWALQGVDFEVARGEVVGVIGRNGAGKSTLLQLICGTLHPTGGSLQVQGRIAALLELGAGFNPDFSGRENVYLNASILGLSQAEIDARYDDIVEFSGIGDFIDQPVKTYSSGMYVRLAFAVATSVDPDILIVDEALSVGDGDFARKSFDRIMALKDAGKTILFCSHSTYQIEAICNRAIWLNEGRVEMFDQPAAVISAYNAYLASLDAARHASCGPASADVTAEAEATSTDLFCTVALPGVGQLLAVEAEVDGVRGKTLLATSKTSELRLYVRFSLGLDLPDPSIAIGIDTLDGQVVSSMTTYHDQQSVSRRPDGTGEICLSLPQLPLRKGDYTVSVFLGCERALHCYDSAVAAIRLSVVQVGTEPGLVYLPHAWL